MVDPLPAGSTNASAPPAPVARGLSKQGVSPEVLYERYRGERGMVLTRFLKFFRDAVLYDNSWTWGHAVTVFFDHAVNDEAAQQEPTRGDDERRLSFHMFRNCLRRFIRQSAIVNAMAHGMAIGGAAPTEFDRWEAFRQIVGNRLYGAPRSDEDLLLNKWFLQEPIQLLCLQNEYRLRRVYKTLVKQKESTVQSWEDLCKPDQPMLLKKDAMTKCLRNLIPQDVGTLRGEDQSNAMRYGNHENTSHEDGGKDTSTGAVCFPEFVEMLVRCALGTTPFRSVPGDVKEKEGDEDDEDEDRDQDKENKGGNEEGEASDARSFNPEADTLPFAQQRIRRIWSWLYDWLDLELQKAIVPAEEGPVLMEDSPTYDEVYSDMQMLFAHYASGEPYSRELDFTDPELRLSLSDLLRQCRDVSLIDSRVTLSAICAEYQRVTGLEITNADKTLTCLQWQNIMVALARIKYHEIAPLDAVRILLRRWLVPMVRARRPRTRPQPRPSRL
jgi:hypothetical protein